VPITTFMLKYLLIIPPFRLGYALVMSLVSIPLLGLLVAMSQAWERASFLQFALALIGVPVALSGYVFISLTTTHSRSEKMLKLAICDSFPFSHMIAQPEERLTL
jgi:hypothetical protein